MKRLLVQELTTRLNVAPYAGAWIETQDMPCKAYANSVAPYAGAWIETQLDLPPLALQVCRSLRGSVD